MNPAAAEALFLPADGGQRYCLYQPAGGRCRGALLYVAPFAEEMHKSRRMAALLAHALAQRGIATLRFDLDGCGDSSGDFADARWGAWHADVARALRWLEQRTGQRAGLLGLRLGALLAADYLAAEPPGSAARQLILWQPVLDGATFLTQFLRLRAAGAMLGAKDGNANSTAALRTRLAAGEALEIGGYELAPALASAIDALKLAPLLRPQDTVSWLDVGAPDRTLAPASAMVLDALRARGVQVALTPVDGTAFWASQEIATCPALLAATVALAPGLAAAPPAAITVNECAYAI
jgi:exosortase A-associated hydrolase 2